MILFNVLKYTMLLNAEIQYIDKVDLNPFITIVLWKSICNVHVTQYEFHQYKFASQFIIIWDFSSWWDVSALNFTAQLCTAKMLNEKCSLNSSSRNCWKCPVFISCNSNCTLKMSEHFRMAFFCVPFCFVILGAAEAVVLRLDKGNHSIFAEQASARKLSDILFWH